MAEESLKTNEDGLVHISKLFAKQDNFFSVGRCHLTEDIANCALAVVGSLSSQRT